jgi:MSHA biogenesis protein MshM
MYYPHFGLKEPPFKITPNTEFFFKGGNRGAILDALVYAIQSGEGIIKVVGEVGSGKTMICRMLQKILPPEIESIYLAIPSVEPEHVLHAIAFELQLKLPRNADRLKVIQLLQNYLLKRHANGEQTVIFVEEAQAMPIATLEEIRLLSNLETNQDKLLQIVLFGQPELDINLNELNIRQLRDRITHSFTLGPLEANDIGEYLIFRLRAAGYFGPPLFTEKSIKKIAYASDGLIRRVNILADKSLLSAFSANEYQVTPKHVSAAIKDSEFGQKPADFKRFFIIALVVSVCLIAALIAMTLKLYRAPQTAVHPTASMTKSGPVETAPVVQAQVELNSNLNEKAVKEAPLDKSTQNSTVFDDNLSLDEKLSISQAALSKIPDDYFTIQLLTSINDDQLNKELASFDHHLDLSQVYLYKQKDKHSAQTVILYGQFKDQLTAKQTIQSFPAKLKQKQPYLRMIGSVKSVINRSIENQ